jgi:hypothetical protein
MSKSARCSCECSMLQCALLTVLHHILCHCTGGQLRSFHIAANAQAAEAAEAAGLTWHVD